MVFNKQLSSTNSKTLILNSPMATVLVIAILYFVLAKTGFLFTSISSKIAPIFLATGLGLAGVLILGRNALIGIWIGAFLANTIHLLTLSTEQPIFLVLTVSFFIASGAFLGAALAGYVVLYLCKGENILSNGKNVLILLLIGSTTYAAVAATFGVLSLMFSKTVNWNDFAFSWSTWWLSDTVGGIVLTPFILAWYNKEYYKIKLSNAFEFLLLGVLTFLFCYLIFFQQGDLKYLLAPIVLGSAYRFGMRITTTIILIITIFSTMVTSMGIGPFAKNNITHSILLLDLFISVITICSLFFAGITSERQRAEEQLKISEKKLRKNQDILQSTIESPKDISIFSLGRNYEYLSFNSLHAKNMQEMNHVSIALGMKLQDCMLNKSELNDALYVLKKAFKGESMTTIKYFEATNSYWELKSSPIENKNKEIIGATMISTNIDERIKSQEALKKSEEKYRNIFENIQDVIFQTDPSGIFWDLNPAIKNFTGYTPEELIGRPTNVLQTDNEEPDAVIKLVNEQFILNDFEKLVKTKSGQLIWVSLNAKMIFDNNGNPHHIDAIARNITEIKKNQNKIAIQNQKLQIQNKELEQFAYITSHDLQEPLLTLNCFSELVKSEFPDDANQNIKQYLNFILESSDRMQKLVKGLLDYSRIGKQIEITKVDCNEIVKDAISSLSDIIQKSNCQITTENLPQINGYSVELIQLFQHLITNAIKFKKEDEPIKINIQSQLEGDYWVISIEDNGIGIEENNTEKIFTIFKRLHNKEEYPGIGIGLAISKKIVALHGGTIWAESTFGKGTIIRFTIPILKQDI